MNEMKVWDGVRKDEEHMMHFFPNRQETENCATHKQNLNCKKATSNKKCLVGQLAGGNSSNEFFAAIKRVYGPPKNCCCANYRCGRFTNAHRETSNSV